MSFPPHLNRPLLPPPGIPPQYAGFPTAPMIPVHMGIMAPTPAVMVQSVPVLSKPPMPKKDYSALRAKDEESSGPITTVFVGNISEKASDMLIRQLLAKCGIVLSWKRVQGASGKLQAFGFCEYKEPESTLRALRLLHDLLIGDKNLLVKVDAKTKSQLDEWKAKKKAANGTKKAEGEDEEEEVLDEETKKRDQTVQELIDGLMREYAAELNAPSQDEESQRRKRKKEKKEEVIVIFLSAQDDINTIDIEEDKRDLISREISKFRDTHKKLEEEKDKREKERVEFERERREREKERERERERRDREREKEREREREREQERSRDRDKDRDRRTRERERGRELDKGRDRSADRSQSRELSRDREKKRDQEDEEEAYERRKLERKLRDKEAAYQEVGTVKEGKRLKEFLEDYDDDRDDPKYYRGSALQKRLRDREKEMEADERDRKREKEELEEIRRRLLDEGHPDPDAELRREEEEERLRQPPIIQEPEPEDHSEEEVEEGEDEDYDNGEENLDVKPPQLKPTMRPITAAPSVSSASGNVSPNTPGDESPCGIIIPHENSPPDALPQDENRPKIGLSLRLTATVSPSQPNAGKRKKLPVDSVFNKFDDEEADEQPRKRKLVPLDYDDDKSLGVDGAGLSSIKGANTEEKRKHIKSLIEKIPTAKPELFSYPLDWSMVDTTLMERRVRPWINKKIIEYIGEEEPTLVDFVCSKVLANILPKPLSCSPAQVLDEEAEVFIVKMWRLLIYETEAKKIGLVK
uniref:RNA binding motif protein 25b n=1 Tax=Nothobranchius furzeri TaxID=105023 RepID=A0A8C6KAS8_NOTFU